MIVGWSPEHTRRAKEVLYRCLEQLEATKAGLYLLGDSGAFELATAYGFGRRDAVAASIAAGHPLWDWIRRHRTTPAFINEPDSKELAAYLEASGTTRVLTIPLAAGGNLVGLVDARDKARRTSFAAEDIAPARDIARAIEALFAEYSLFGSTPAEAPPPTPTPAAAPALTAIHHTTLAGLAAVLRALAGGPEVAAVALTASDGTTTRTATWGAIPLELAQREAVMQHQSDALARLGMQAPDTRKWAWSEAVESPRAARADAIHTSVLHFSPQAAIVVSVLGPAGSAAAEIVTGVAASHLALARSLRAYRVAARNLARTLLEPGEATFPHLRHHSQAVSELAQRLAVAAGLGGDEEELVTVAAYLHDVGMRELDYARIYRMPRPGETERRLYSRHPVIGARIVDSAMFPGDLAGAIRHHHERWDGTGYPQQLAGEAIPLASRIIHLAEVWDTLVSQTSYKPAIPREAALTAIRAEAGKQFDPALVPLLEQLVGA